MAQSNDIKDRIRKLLAMGRGAANEHEARIAMERAHKLLAMHNLTETDVEGRDKEDAYENLSWQSSWTGLWARYCAQAIARLNFCQYYFRPGKAGSFEHHFVGRSVNVAMAQAVAEMVIGSLRTEAHRRSTDAAFRTSFKNAAGSRVVQRVNELMQQAALVGMTGDDGSKMTAIALRDAYKAEEEGAKAFLAGAVGPLHQSKGRTRSRSTDGYIAGRAAGDRVSLRPEVGGSRREAIK